MPNRLAQQTSPYLQQHADNPVDWYPWGEEALAKARAQGKPILLSIGYSACHWCHVMAHESFEDPATAQVMNDLFVNVKVDREERPDLDKLYQTAHALLTQRPGGWPLTMFLSPQDQVPFFGGTYFPREARYGLPAFVDLLRRIAEFHREHGAEIEKQNASMVAALASLWGKREGDGALEDSLLARAREELLADFDAVHGGFGRAPKFPHPSSLERLLRHWALSSHAAAPDASAQEAALFTLRRMAEGGVYDQLGGGFCRYSVDDFWMIPHFEKMLYDNGPLLALYAEAAAATGERFYAEVAHGTARWVMREMQSPEGGYYSTLDADSEGYEGKFYVWDREEVRALLEADDHALFARRYGLDRAPNFEGRWHLHGFVGVPDLARETGRAIEDVEAALDRARARLFETRERRVRPGRDEKILTAWNGLMIKGMASAARHLQAPEYAASATRALDLVHTTLWKEGRLLATYKDGRAQLAAYLDDYAFMLDGVLELLQLRWRSEDLRFAQALAEALLAHFEDRAHGGFYFTADDHERLVQRPKTYADEATPAGNGVAALCLARLGHLLGEPRYLQAAERTLESAAALMAQSPAGHCSLLTALEEWLYPPQVVILRGSGEPLEAWRRACAATYAPRRYVRAIPADARDLPAALAGKPARGEAVAYVCTGTTCSPPIERAQALADMLAQTQARAA